MARLDFRWALLAIVAGGVVLRVLYTLLEAPWPPPALDDQYYFSALPKLIADGMFLVGLDIVGDKLMEVNVFSPGGLGSCGALYDVDFTTAVIADLERKTGVREHYGSKLPNIQRATI